MSPLLECAVVCAGLMFWAIPAANPDLGWHLFGGWYITTTGWVPEIDPVNSLNPYWHDYHWLAQLVFYESFRAGGFMVLRVMLGLLTAYLFLLMLDIAYAAQGRSDRHLVPALACSGGILLMHDIPDIRPHLFSLIGIAVVLRSLLRGHERWQVWAFFALAVVLVNVHVYWVLVPGLWFAYRCVPRMLGRRGFSAIEAWGGLLLLGSAGLISPYGLFGARHVFADVFRNYFVLLDYMNTPAVLREGVGELRSIFAGPAMDWLLVLFVLALMVRRAHWKRMIAAAPRSLIAWVPLLLCLFMKKYVGPAAIFAIPFIVRDVMPRGASGAWLRQLEQRALNPLLCTWILLSVVLMVKDNPFADDTPAQLERMYPMAACRRVAALNPHPIATRDHVRVLTHFNDGGWCRWAMHVENPALDARVTTDNRTQWVPGQDYERSSRIFLMGVGWKSMLEGWDPDFLVLPGLQPVTGRLLEMGDVWELIYKDRRGVALRRRR